MYENIHSHLTLNRQKLKTIQVSISRRKDKWITDTQTVVLSHNGVLFSNKKEQMTGTWLDDSQKPQAESKKSFLSMYLFKEVLHKRVHAI